MNQVIEQPREASLRDHGRRRTGRLHGIPISTRHPIIRSHCRRGTTSGPRSRGRTGRRRARCNPRTRSRRRTVLSLRQELHRQAPRLRRPRVGGPADTVRASDLVWAHQPADVSRLTRSPSKPRGGCVWLFRIAYTSRTSLAAVSLPARLRRDGHRPANSTFPSLRVHLAEERSFHPCVGQEWDSSSALCWLSGALMVGIKPALLR